MRQVRWCAIGDSFTYLNDHLDETGFCVTRGYLSRVCDNMKELSLMNLGVNGSTTRDWLTIEIPEADVYTVLLGTNDWNQGIVLGSADDFMNRRQGTILGNLGDLIGRIERIAPDGRIVVMTPVERGDFVYIGDPANHAHGSYAPVEGQMLCDIADGIAEAAETAGLAVLPLHRTAGFTVENAVHFKRLRNGDGYEDFPYPDFIGISYDEKNDRYPYPKEAAFMTYDGLHPSDKGNEIIARLLSEKIRQVLEEK